MKSTLPGRVKRLIKKLKKEGFEAFVVGGSVRDFFVNREPNDYDIVTNATPKDIIKIFNKRFILNRKRIKHNTLYVMFYGLLIDVTCYRCDDEFTIIDDLKMRDFTINSIAYGEEFIDPLNGIEDIENKVIRACNLETFIDDPHRILRGIRLVSTLGFEMEEQLKRLIKKNYILLSKNSIYKTNGELYKIFSGEYLYEAMMEFWEAFCILIPELNYLISYDEDTNEVNLELYENVVKQISNIKNDYITRVATLLYQVVKHGFEFDVEGIEKQIQNKKMIYHDILNRHAIAVKIKEEILYLIQNIDMPIHTNMEIQKLIAKTPNGTIDSCVRLIDMKKALNIDLDHCDSALTILDEMNSKDFMTLQKLELTIRDLNGFKFNHDISKEIQCEIIDLIVEGELENNHKQLLKYVKNIRHQYIESI